MDSNSPRICRMDGVGGQRPKMAKRMVSLLCVRNGNLNDGKSAVGKTETPGA